jgi:hypothetical protein
MPYGASLSFETAAHLGLPPDTPLQAKIILNHVPLSLSVSASLCQGAGKGIATSFLYTMLIAPTFHSTSFCETSFNTGPLFAMAGRFKTKDSTLKKIKNAKNEE